MVDIASLAIQIDTSDVARAEGDLERLGSKGAKAEQAAKGVGDAYQQASGKVGAVAGAASEAGTALERNSVAARENARELASVDRTASSLSGSMSKLGATLAGLTAGMSIKGIIDISDSYGQMADRIKMATDSTEEYRMVQERLLQSANKTYRPLAEAQELYIRTADAIRSLGYQTKDALDITDSFSYLLVTNAASADKASNAIDAYSKSIQSGRIEVDSWQSLMAAMPSVVETLSGSLGKSAEEIRQLGITGKLSLSDLNEGLRQTVDANQKLADGMGTTLNDALIRASNNMSTYLGESSKVTASSRLLSGALDGVTDNIDLIAATLGGVAVAAVARYAAVTAKSTAASVAQSIAAGRQAAEELKLAQAQVAATTAAVALARANIGLTSSTGQVTAALTAQEAAQKRLAAAQAASVGLGRTVLGLAGGWAGLALTAGAVALSFVDWGDGAEEAARKSIALREETNLLTRAVQDLDAAQAKQVLQRMEEPYQAAKDEARNYAAQIEYLNAQLDRHPGSAKVEDWNRALVNAKGNLSTVNQELSAQEAKMRDLNARIEQNTKAWKGNSEAASETDKEGQSFIASLQRRADLSGKLTEVQKTQIAIEKGYAGVLSETAKQEALAAAAVIDRASAALNAGKGIAKATNDQAAAFKSLMDGLFPAEAAQRQYNEQVALLDKYLDGDQLAKAVDKLNHSLAGADATGPADAIEQYRKELEELEDRLDPVGKATKTFTEEQKRLTDAIARGGPETAKYQKLLTELERQYGENSKATNEWTKWTEDSLERVDSAFADAWRNIGDGFDGFRDSLTSAFKQMLAELAHMAITKPIIMQIGASLGIGGGSSGGGLLSSVMGGGSGGGMDFGKILNYGQSIYSGLTGVGPAVLAGYQSGGIGGALSGGAGYYGNLAGNAASTVGGWLGVGGGAAASSAAAQAAGAAAGNSLGVNAGAYAAQGGAGAGAGLGGLGALAGPAAAAFAALQAYKAYGDGVRLEAKDTRGNAAAWATGYQPFAEINGAVSKLTEALGIGGALGNILNIPSTLTAMVGSALFGGGWETKNAGLAFSVAGGDLKAQSYEDQKKKGGLFSSSKKRTRYKNLDAQTDSAFQDMFQYTEDSVAEMFEALGLSVEESSLDGLKIARKKISTKGKTDEQIKAAIGKWFGTVSEAMNTELNKVFNTGLGLDLAGMRAFVGNLSGVNAALEAINLTAYESSVAGGKLAVKLAEAAGGLEALAASTNTYYGAFFSEAEKVEDTLGAVQKAFSDSDIVLADSRESYRNMVEDIDLTSDAGQRMFASLMGLAGQADTYYGILEARAAQAAQEAAQLAAVQAQAAALYYDQFTSPSKKASDAVASVVAQFEALGLALPGTRGGFMAAVDALDKTSESGLRMFNTLMGVAGAADVYYDNLEARAAQAVTGAYSLLERSVAAEKSALTAAYTQEKAEQDALLQSRRESQAQAASARATAYTDMAQTASAMSSALSGLSSALSAAIGQLVDDSSSAVEQRRSVAVAQLQRALSSGDLSNADSLAEAAKVAASVDSGLYGSFDDLRREQGRTANMLLELGDISALRQTAADAQAEAMQRMAEQATNDAQSFRQSIGSVKTSVDMAYEAEIAALDEQLALGKSQIDALNGIDNSVVSVADAVSALTAAISAALSIIPGMSGISVPGFAAGGLHAGGLRLVGEHGPELEVTGPSRIYNASNTAAMLGGGETAPEVRGLRKEVGDLRAYLYQIAKNTGNTATGIRQQNEIGLPEAV